MHDSKTFLTTRQFAESLGVSESSVKRWVDDGDIAADRTAGGHRRIPVAAAVGFIRLRRIRPEKPQLLPLAETPALGNLDSASSEELHEALLDDDAATARAIICGRFLSGASVAAIGDGLLRPALERIGEIWKHDPRGILIEHRAVQSCSQALGQIAAWIPEPATAAPAAITSAGPADPYMLPPLLAFMTLRECGMRVVNLGPTTPLTTIELAITQYAAALCVVSVSVPQNTLATPAWNSLQKRAAIDKCRLVVGGRCVSSLADRLAPATHIARSMAELAAYSRGLVEGARLLPSPRTRRPSRGTRP